MTYIYDINVNLSKELYDFYDWNNSDNFCHIRKTPIFKVSDNLINDILINKIRVCSEFIDNIYNKTFTFDDSNNIKNACLLSSINKSIFLVFDNKGFIIYKSNLLVSEELEILDVVDNMKISKIKYNIVGKNKISNMLRSEKLVVDKLLKELNDIKDNKEKIDYLYYEWFNTLSGNNKYELLINSIKSEYTDKHEELLDIVNLCINNK